MHPPSRTRRIAKWSGLVVCVVILGMWVTSVLRPSGVLSRQFGGVYWSCGVLIFVVGDFAIDFQSPGNLSSIVLPIGPSPLNWHETLGLSELPRTWRFLGTVAVIMPLWLLLTLAAIPTAILWLRDRRTVEPGCCRQCGYDLRASKKTCPECGAAVAESR